MILAVNIGNTAITIGGMEEDRAQFTASISTRKTATAYEYANSIGQVFSLYHVRTEQITGAILSSVVPVLTATVKQGMELFCNCPVLEVSAGIKTGLNIRTGQGANLGADFVCCAVAALAEYSAPCIIVSLGTATTFAALDAHGQFLGTSITAGVQISLEALRSHAARLPEISLDAPAELIGANTVEAMKSGLLYGTASMVDGMAERYTAVLGERTTLLMTGRYAKDILPFCRKNYRCDEQLLLKGLSLLYRKNKKTAVSPK